MQERWAATPAALRAGIGLVLVGFSPPDRLAPIARHLGWTGAVLGDQERALYARLGIGRAPLWRVYTPRTVAIYARRFAVALRERRIRDGALPRLPATGEDTRQLGGDAIVRDGIVVARWRPRSPDDRPPAAEVLDVATRLAARPDSASGPAADR